MDIIRIGKNKSQLVFKGEQSHSIVSLKVTFKKGQEDSKPNINNICSLEAFHKALDNTEQGNDTFIGFFTAGDYKVNQVFILLDDWAEHGSYDRGYELARELLNTIGGKKQFNLRFVSAFKQEQLLNMVKNDNKIMVKTFPHLWLFDGEIEISPQAYSKTHFWLIRDIAVSDKGRLATIRHDVRNIILPKEEDASYFNLEEQSTKQKQHTLSILDDLDCEAYNNCYPKNRGQLAKLRKHANEIKNVGSAEELIEKTNDINYEIFKLIDEIEGSLIEPESNTPKIKKEYSVLIIDDDPVQREELCRFFRNHFTSVSCNDNSEDEKVAGFSLKDPESALKWVKSGSIKYFDIVILDLLFKNQSNDMWLPFDGLDLFREIRFNHPFCAIRIITSLPRNEISVIVGDGGLNLPLNHIFTKANGWPQLEGCLYDRLDEIGKEREKQINQKQLVGIMPMPKIGLFQAHIRDYIASLRSEKFDDEGQVTSDFQPYYRRALSLAEMAKNGSITSKDFELFTKSEKLTTENFMTKFHVILAIRHLFIEWASKDYTERGQLQINPKGFFEKYKGKVADSANKLRDVGLNKKKDKSGIDTIVLKFDNMFPEERAFFETNRPQNVSDDVSSWVLCFVLTKFEQNEYLKELASYMTLKSNFDNITYERLKNLFNDCYKLLNKGDDISLEDFESKKVSEKKLQKDFKKKQSIRATLISVFKINKEVQRVYEINMADVLDKLNKNNISLSE